MARNYFENLPSTNTPLRAERLNGFLNGEESIEKFVVGNVECKNLFTGLVKGVDLSQTNGSESLVATAASSDFIPIDLSNGAKITFSGLPTTISNMYMGYNASKQFLGRTSGVTLSSRTLNSNSFSYGTPQGTGDVAYVRLRQYVASTSTGTIDDIDNAKIQLEYGETATTYAEHIEFNSRAYLLWKNLTPTSEFAGQTITLNDNITNYKYYEIIYKVSTSNNNTFNTGKIPTDVTTYLLMTLNYIYRRDVSSVGGTSITFGAGERYGTYGSSSRATMNDYAIPIQVLGFK